MFVFWPTCTTYSEGRSRTGNKRWYRAVSHGAGGAKAERRSIRAEPSRVVMREQPQYYMPPAAIGQRRHIKKLRYREEHSASVVLSWCTL